MNKINQTASILRNRQYLALVITALAFVFLTFTCCNNQDIAPSGSVDSPVLARVEVPGHLQDITLPVYAALEDSAGTYYALVVATRGQLVDAGLTYRVIDGYSSDNSYLLGETDRAGAHEKAAQTNKVLYDDGQWIIARYEPDLDETFAEMGFDLKMMSDTPITFTPPDADVEINEDNTARKQGIATFVENPKVREMMGKILESDVRSYISGLSGYTAVSVDGASYTFTTRHTKSGEPVTKATQYIYEQLNGVGNLTATFHDWVKVTKYAGGETRCACRNVVVELPGKEKPGEIIILVAHLDSINDSGLGEPAPGADDDASGCAGLLTIAKVMANYDYKRTIRFVFATGEEQGTYGSEKYADTVKGQKIVAVLNLDMISYNTQASPPKQRVKTRKTNDENGYKADLAIANIYKNVVNTYGLGESINSIIQPDGEVNGDQSSFWDKGFAAIWVIEDDYENFNKDNMHSKDDKLQTLNMPYCTNLVKAAIGTAAHLANPL
jgi:hypothetical protein